jgi:hypothetical protein
MTSAVQPIHSVDLKPVDPLQSSMPARLDTLSRAAEVAPGASAIQSISEREVAFSKLMATSGASDSSQVTRTSEKVSDASSTSQTADTQKTSQASATVAASSPQSTEQIFNSLDKDTKAGIIDLLATLKKELTATEFQALKVGWVGQNGSENEFALSYFFYINQVVQDGVRMLNRFEDDLKNA